MQEETYHWITDLSLDNVSKRHGHRLVCPQPFAVEGINEPVAQLCSFCQQIFVI